MKYFCQLVDKSGVVRESFFREHESEEKCLEGLKMFRWPKGCRWRINLANADPENDWRRWEDLPK